jgi:hypothetical protein
MWFSFRVGDAGGVPSAQESTGRLQDSGDVIATGVFSGVSAAGSILVTLALVLVLSFFFVFFKIPETKGVALEETGSLSVVRGRRREKDGVGGAK